MARFPSIALVLVLIGTPFVGRLVGQPKQGVIGGVTGGPAPQRDPSQPVMRRIPVGTAVISGTVTTADTGRPIRGARVSVNGLTAYAAARLGGPGAAPPASAAVPSGVMTMSQMGGQAIGRGIGPGPGRSGAIAPAASRTAITDASGEFLFERLPAGQYTLSVSRNQFLTTSYGQRKPGGTGTSFPLADGQKAKVNLQMIRGGVITGMVMTEDGDPQSNTQIRGWRYVMFTGVRRLQPVGYATTDDRGMYRLFGLEPGDYVVSATPSGSEIAMMDRMHADTALIEQAIASGAVQPPAAPGLPATVAIPVASPQQQMQQRQIDGPPPGYLPVYHPNSSTAADASVVHVAGGDERANVDIRVRLIQASNIQGTITNPPGQELGVQLALVNNDPMSEERAGTRVEASGRFTFRNVAPGQYTIMAQVIAAPTMTIVNGVPTQPQGPPPQLTDAQKMWAHAVVSVAGEPLISTSLTLRPGRSISGQLLFEMERPPDLTRTKITVTLGTAPGVQQSMYSPPPQAEVGPDGRFTLNGVIPGKYVVRPQGGGFLKSAIVNGIDTLDVPLDFTGTRDVTDVVLTVTDKTTEVSGSLTDGAGKPALDYTIVAASAEERFWTPGSRRIGIARAGIDGRYALRNLPPGTYLLAAVMDLEQGGQYDPEFLRSLAGAAAMRITLSEGGKLAQDLRVGR